MHRRMRGGVDLSRRWPLGIAVAAVLLVGGCGVAARSAAADWNGTQAWSRLARLGDYSYRSSVLEIFTPPSVSIEQSGVQATNGDYTAALYGQSAKFSWLGVSKLVRAHGDYYGYVAFPAPNSGFKVGWYRFGSVLNPPYDSIRTYFGLLSVLWSQRLRDSTGTYAGTCSAAGRKGSLFTVHFRLPQGVGRKTADGTACVDQATGAVLRVDIVFHATTPSGTPVVFADHFSVTQVGGIAPIAAPTGAKAAPKASVIP